MCGISALSYKSGKIIDKNMRLTKRVSTRAAIFPSFKIAILKLTISLTILVKFHKIPLMRNLGGVRYLKFLKNKLENQEFSWGIPFSES